MIIQKLNITNLKLGHDVIGIMKGSRSFKRANNKSVITGS